MPMPVMRIRKVGVGVRKRCMLVRMLVHILVPTLARLPKCHRLGMRVGVVHIAARTVDIAVAVLMVVKQRLVRVLVAMPFSQVQCDPNGHQHAANQQRQRDWIA